MPSIHRVVPFEGIDNARFGMTPEQLADILGDADEVRHNRILEDTAERRGATEYVFHDGVLSEIVAYRPGRGKAIREQLDGARYAPVFYDDIEILDEQGFEMLRAREQTKEGIGGHSVLFPELGLLVTGFGKRVPEGAYATVFQREQLDHFEILLDV
ncbi:hypothetical protein [Gulosibacter sp. 10]|uniref:hypothetical protein n=1 Tax=Gulosibacter sp. 10 TaxID=1255570 RepID=UPI00097EFDBE|nr:hypothetical protein [Gulosibacter sp. 10]SJM66752.1 hypothetical protein FM112_12040 [Gulosibacter sp. 10]